MVEQPLRTHSRVKAERLRQIAERFANTILLPDHIDALPRAGREGLSRARRGSLPRACRGSLPRACRGSLPRACRGSLPRACRGVAEADRSLVGLLQRREDPHQRRLAGAVSAEEAEHPRWDVERHAFQRLGAVRVCLRQVADGQMHLLGLVTRGWWLDTRAGRWLTLDKP